MPHLVRWHQELADFGLVIVGMHVQNATPEEVRAKALGLGIRFPITAGGSTEGATSNGIPFSVLYDHHGKAIYSGNPKAAEAKLRSAVGDAIVAEAGLAMVNKQLVPIVDDLKKGGAPLKALQKLLPISKGKGEAAEQAKALVEKMLARGQRKIDGLAEHAKDEPVDAYETATRLSASFKGTPVGTKAGEWATKLKVDKRVVAELKARPSLDAIKRIDLALSRVAATVDPKSAEFKKAYAAQLKQLNTTLKSMKTSWPDAPATKEAVEIADKYDVTGS